MKKNKIIFFIKTFEKKEFNTIVEKLKQLFKKDSEEYKEKKEQTKYEPKQKFLKQIKKLIQELKIPTSQLNNLHLIQAFANYNIATQYLIEKDETKKCK